MFVLRRVLIWFLLIFWVLGLELVKLNHSHFWWVISFFLLFTVFTVFMVCKLKFNKAVAHFLILPVALCLSSFIFLLFLVNLYAFHGLVILTGLGLYFLLKQYFLYFNFPYKYQPYSLESLTFYISLMSFYFLFSSGFASLTLLKFNIFLVLFIIIPIVGLVIYQFFWVHKINWSKSWLFIVFLCLITAQLFIALSYLPTSYYVNAFILVLTSYLMLGMSKASIQNVLDKKKIVSYLTVGSVLFLLVLGTAQWT